jgi:hypothetical protein
VAAAGFTRVAYWGDVSAVRAGLRRSGAGHRRLVGHDVVLGPRPDRPAPPWAASRPLVDPRRGDGPRGGQARSGQPVRTWGTGPARRRRHPWWLPARRARERVGAERDGGASGRRSGRRRVPAWAASAG